MKTKDDIGTLCDRCKNASSCRWALYGRPIPGWVAAETVIRNKDHDIKGFRVKLCPEFVLDKRCVKGEYRKDKPWTEDDIGAVISNYGKLQTRTIAEALGRSVEGVQYIVGELRKKGVQI